ncbi:MAG: alkaline phosphatase family protein [Saprospiraceae bacterium]|nr:alkaline phosphatase family protein [Saprospiraceae bacterium]
MRKGFLLGLITCSIGHGFAQPITSGELRSGPMVGYSEMREIMLWVQTDKAATVEIAYWEKGTTEASQYRTESAQTQKAKAFTAHLLADKVQPGKDYQGSVYIDGRLVDLPYPFEFHARDLWYWRTDPPDFKAAIGSCAYINEEAYDRPGEGYGQHEEIFTSIYSDDPDLMLWLGDNIYLREADWNTFTGIYHRYTHTRSQSFLQPLLASTHHYAIWDDHDFGPNDSDRSFVHKDKTEEAFKQFWANPSYGLEGQGGITSMFTWSDCDFFLLDNRYFRAPNGRTTGERTLLGKHQLRWIIDALKYSKAPFKFVCIGGMVLSSAKVFENYINLYPEEREQLLDAIQTEGITGVIFLTGDRHHTELSTWQPEGGVTIHDLTISPLTSTAYGGDQGKNQYLVEGTEVEKKQNYGLLEVTGPRKDRKLKIWVKDHLGNLLWSREITANSMR